jgi:hypothetical protein
MHYVLVLYTVLCTVLCGVVLCTVVLCTVLYINHYNVSYMYIPIDHRDWFSQPKSDVQLLVSELAVERRLRQSAEERLRRAEEFQRAAEMERDTFRVSRLYDVGYLLTCSLYDVCHMHIAYPTPVGSHASQPLLIQ